MDWFVLPRLQSVPHVDAAEVPYYLVASLFGYWYHGKDRIERTELDLGGSLARLSRSVPNPDSVEQRFVALLNSHRDDLAHHLRHAVGLLRSKEIPVNWAKLLHDVNRWQQANRAAQHAWARSFWQHTEPEDKSSGRDTTGVKSAVTATERSG